MSTRDTHTYSEAEWQARVDLAAAYVSRTISE